MPRPSWVERNFLILCPTVVGLALGLARAMHLTRDQLDANLSEEGQAIVAFVVLISVGLILLFDDPEAR